MQPTIAVIAQGAMGAGVAGRLVAHGAKVVTSLAGRSPASAERARQAGMTATSDQELAGADIFLSIVPPGEALALAERFAPLLRGKPIIYADCNAVSPDTKRQVAEVMRATGCPFVDVGIIGGPPDGSGYSPALYASGEHASRLAVLGRHGLKVPVIEGPVGAAAALKMSYAGITKGFTAIGAAMMLGATDAGAADALRRELAESQPALLAWLTRQMPTMYGKAYRWVAEMEEIADFVGRHPGAEQIYRGAAQLYDQFAEDFASAQDHSKALARFVSADRTDAG
jgi:3-hydroxyisobutyrate dehydrogenase-like beta-hydroxyacid dehydrogenase